MSGFHHMVRHPHGTCRCGKRNYPSEAVAVRELRACQASGRPEQRYYQCTLSNTYHLTSQPKREAA